MRIARNDVFKMVPLALTLLGGCMTEGPEGEIEEPEITAPEPPLPSGLNRDNPAFGSEKGSSGPVETAQAALSSQAGTVPHGGGGGGVFNFYANENWRLIHIRMSCGKYMDSIELFWRDRNNDVHNARAGGNGGSTVVDIPLAPDEVIVSAHGNSGKYFDKLGFTTSKGFVYTCENHDEGSNSFPFPRPRGTNDNVGGTPFTEPNMAGKSIHGIFGRSGKTLDQIGFYFYNL
jgi:Jacalin-like lectin domain